MIAFFRKWFEIFRPFYKKLIRDNIFAIAGQSAFFMLLSAVPLAIFVVSVLQSLKIPVEYVEQTAGLLLNAEATKVVTDFMSNVYDSTVSISLVSLLATLWSAAKGIHSINNGLNRVYNAYENRNWLALRLRAMFYTVVMFFIMLATMLVVVLGSTINNLIKPYLGNMPDYVTVLYYLRYPIVFVYLVVLFALMYRNFPNIGREKRREYGFFSQLPGALFSAAAWFVLALGISIYVNDFNGYSIYGGLTRLAVVMVWLYFCLVCLMIGAEFNYFFHDEIKWFSRKFRRKKK